MKGNKLTLYIFIALLAGIAFGVICPNIAAKTQFLSVIFLNMIKMIIAPLLFSTLIVGIAGHGDIKNLGKIGLKTIFYFELVTTIALSIGLVVGNVFKPGKGFIADASTAQVVMINSMAAEHHHESLGQMIISMFPTSIVDSMATGNILQIVVFAVFFAIAICSVGEKAKPVVNILSSVSEIMFKFTELVMWFAPIGIFSAIASTVAQNGIKILINYGKIILSLYAALAIFVLCLLFIICTICKVSFRGLVRALYEPALVAFSTASSEAALPKGMEVMERFGVPKNIVGFVMPTGYTFNLDGSTLYLALGVLFSTQIMNIDLTIQQQLFIMGALMLTSKGIAGVPRVSLVVMAGTLSTLDYPIIGVAILLGIDQILDMGRTTVNLIGNCVATVVIAKWENDFDYEKMEHFISYSKKKSALIKRFKERKEEREKSIVNLK